MKASFNDHFDSQQTKTLFDHLDARPSTSRPSVHMWVEMNIAISAEYLSARRRSLKQFDGLDHRRTNRPKVPLRRQRAPAGFTRRC